MKKPEVNIDFAINTRGQLVQYFVNPFNACHGYIIDGVRIQKHILFEGSLIFTHLENSFK